MGAAHGRWWDDIAEEDLGPEVPEWIPKAQVIAFWEGHGGGQEGNGDDPGEGQGQGEEKEQGEEAKQDSGEPGSTGSSETRAGSRRAWDEETERWWLERAQARRNASWRPLPPRVGTARSDTEGNSADPKEPKKGKGKGKGRVKAKGKGKIKGKRKTAKATEVEGKIKGKKKSETEVEGNDSRKAEGESQLEAAPRPHELNAYQDDDRNDGRWLCREELEFELHFRRTSFDALAAGTACSFAAPSAPSLPHPWCSDDAAAAADRCASLTGEEINTSTVSPSQRSVHFAPDVAGKASLRVAPEDAWFALEWLLGAMRVCDSDTGDETGPGGGADRAGSGAHDREQYVAKARAVIHAPGFVQQCFGGLSGRGTGGAKEGEQLLELLTQLHEGVATHAGAVDDVLNSEGMAVRTSSTHAFVCGDGVRAATRTDPKGWDPWEVSDERQFCGHLVKLFQGWLQRHNSPRDA